MQKRNFKNLFIILMAATFLLLTFSVALAADCSNGDPNTCWKFSLGYEIEVVDKGVLENGMEKWRYSVIKSPSVKSTNTNFIAMGLETGLQIDAVNGDVAYPCEGESTLNIGIGDCLRQWAKWTPNFNTGLTYIIFYVQPVEKSSVMPIAMKAGSDMENGQIIGPAADTTQIIESTFFIDQTQDGRALAVKMDRNGEIIQAWSCDADCEDFPTNFTEIITPTIPLSSTYFCIPSGGSFGDNSTLTIDGSPISSLHCGTVEFKDVDSSIQISNRGSCRVLPSGGLFCY